MKILHSIVNKISSFQLALVLIVLAQSTFANPVSNNSTTDWNTASGWIPSGVPNLVIWNGTQHAVVSHNKTSGSLIVKNGNSIRVTSGAILTINGNLTLGYSSSLTVDIGATLIITGSLLATNSPSTITIDGVLNVGGNYSVSTSGVTHNHSGIVTVGGNMSVIGNTNIKVLGGSVAITGQLKLGNNGVMSGCSGRVNYGSYDINACGFSYLKCCSSKRGTGCGNTPPPPNGMDFSNCAAPPPCNSIGGSALSSTTVCSGSNSGDLNLFGENGSILRWEKSTDNWNTVNTISNTSDIQSYTNLTESTKYRAVVRDGSCPQALSSEVTITVDFPSVGGTVSSSTNVCIGINSGILNLTDQTGDVARWEKTTNNWSTVTSISNTTDSQDYLNLTETTKYRAIVQSGSCSEATSSEVTITVDSESVGGSISSDANVCSGSNSGTLNLTGQTGDVARWEKTTNNWSTVTSISNTTDSQDYLNLTETTKYRAIVQSGACSEATSSEVTITVDAESVGGVLSKDTSVCIGVNSGDLFLTGQIGSVVRWEVSTDNFANTTYISNTTLSESFSNITENTKYRVVLQSGVCSPQSSNEVLIAVNPLPNVNLGEDTAICIGSSLDLDADVGVTWIWNNGDNTKRTTISDSGNYNVIVTDENECVGYDTILVSNHQETLVDLGEDTLLCPKTSFVLNAGPNGTEYLWNDNSISDTLAVFSKGTYSVIVTDLNNCVSYDTISVDTFPSPKPNIDVNDTSICSGDFLTLTTEFGFDSYSWTNSSSTTNQAIVQDENTYVVKVWDSNGCEGTDTVRVVVNDLPNLSIEDSVQLCLYKDLFITAPQINGDYNWNTGETSQEIHIINPGKYWIDLIDENNCQSSDTIIVYEGPNLMIHLGNDTTLCIGDSIHLDAGDYSTEIWQGQDTATAIYASSDSMYHVLAINEEGCFGRDTILVELSPVPQVNIIQEDSLEICENIGEEITLTIENDEGMEIYWDCGIDNAEATIYSEGRYIVSKTNQFLCVAYDTITILPYCKPIVLTMPNVITPNGDGTNELHVPIETATEDIDYIMSRITEITYTVHNRWGRLIHISEGDLPSWNGINQKTGEEAASGTYYWVLHYKDDAGGSFTLNGFVELFR